MREPCCDLQSEQGRPIYGWRRVAISDGGRAIGRAKKEGRNSYGGVGIFSTVSCPSRRAREMVKWCCSCTRHSTCSATGLSAQACKCRNAGRQCTGCHCWGKFRNQGRFMPSLIRGTYQRFLSSKTCTHKIPKNRIYFTSFSSVRNGQNYRNYREQFLHHLRSTPSTASPGTPQTSPSY